MADSDENRAQWGLGAILAGRAGRASVVLLADDAPTPPAYVPDPETVAILENDVPPARTPRGRMRARGGVAGKRKNGRRQIDLGALDLLLQTLTPAVDEALRPEDLNGVDAARRAANRGTRRLEREVQLLREDRDRWVQHYASIVDRNVVLLNENVTLRAEHANCAADKLAALTTMREATTGRIREAEAQRERIERQMRQDAITLAWLRARLMTCFDALVECRQRMVAGGVVLTPEARRVLVTGVGRRRLVELDSETREDT